MPHKLTRSNDHPFMIFWQITTCRYRAVQSRVNLRKKLERKLWKLRSEEVARNWSCYIINCSFIANFSQWWPTSISSNGFFKMYVIFNFMQFYILPSCIVKIPIIQYLIFFKKLVHLSNNKNVYIRRTYQRYRSKLLQTMLELAST